MKTNPNQIGVYMTGILIIFVQYARSQALDSVLKGYPVKTEIPQLADYVQTALANNPRIQSAFHQWRSETKRIAAARGLPDPQISFGYFLKNIETAVGPQEWKAGVMQKIPWPGKLLVQGDMQSLKADIAFQQLQQMVSDLIYQVQAVYLDGYFLEQSIAITQENLTLVRQWEQIVLTKYISASAGHPDLIKTQIEAIKLQDDLATLKSKRRPIREALRALLNSDTLSAIVFPDFLPDPQIPWTKAQVRETVLNHNPGLRGKASAHRMAGKAVTRAKLNWLPDFSVGADYISTGNRVMGGNPVPGSGKDPLVVMGSISVPLWGIKQAGQVRAAREAELQAESAVRDTRNRLKARFESAWFEYEDAGRKFRLYHNRLLAKSLESLNATQKAYIGAELDFLSLVDAQRRHLDFTLAAEKAKVDYYKSAAELQKLAGRSL